MPEMKHLIESNCETSDKTKFSSFSAKLLSTLVNYG